MTPQASHTPGPWIYHLGRGANPRFHVQTTCGYQIASTTELSKHSQAVEENAAREANARLIAAAPDLLSTLQMIESRTRTDGRMEGFSPNEVIELKALIARATQPEGK